MHGSSALYRQQAGVMQFLFSGLQFANPDFSVCHFLELSLLPFQLTQEVWSVAFIVVVNIE